MQVPSGRFHWLSPGFPPIRAFEAAADPTHLAPPRTIFLLKVVTSLKNFAKGE